MPDDTDKLIEEHMRALPVYVKDAFRAAKPFEKIRAIGNDFKLHIDQEQVLEQEILLVMLGLEGPDSFIDETSKSFGLSDEDSKKLVERVSAELFIPIRESMQLYTEEIEKRTGTAGAPVPQPEAHPVTPRPKAPLMPPTASVRESRPTFGGVASVFAAKPAVPVVQVSPLASPPVPSVPKPPTIPAPERVTVPAPPTAAVGVPAVQTPQLVPVTPTAPNATRPPSPTNSVDDILQNPHASSAERIDVGISAPKPSYKIDPYLEPPV